ncbi:MAG: hypothetical protein K2M10_07440 [Muribaculaceae bacterium]|nr:hypothetical protein [Muribaculaceae bacterium]MDE6299460.1 hypothetical protein [Muribaculaceae bacterium]
MKLIFSIGYIPKREDFKELTPQQYASFRLKVPESERKDLENQRILAFLPDDPKVYSRLVKVYGNDLVIVGSDEVKSFDEVRKIIDKYCDNSKQSLDNETDKLIYMAKTLPDVFSEGTPFSIHALNKPWKNNKKSGPKFDSRSTQDD